MAYMLTEERLLDLIDTVGGVLFDLEELLPLFDLSGGEPIEWDLEARKETLKGLTLAVYQLELDLACYPLSDAAVVFFEPPP